MIVIVGNEVDTVIRFSRGGSADMPQISSYPDKAEAAVYADQRLAKQRASGRRNTTGEGSDWPRDWKLDKARAAGKIWYAESRPIRLKVASVGGAKFEFSLKRPTAEELRAAHEKYTRTVPNSYAASIQRVFAALSSRNAEELAMAVSQWLLDINSGNYYRFRPEEKPTLVGRLRPIMQKELESLLKFHVRSVKTLAESDKVEVIRLFNLLRAECGPVGAGKALAVLAVNFFPLWDDKIARAYGIPKDDVGYFRFMNLLKEQVENLPENLVPGVSVLKVLDEYNYLQISASSDACA
jgi:hypothetical protein